jgi:hypothetical protein
MLAHCGGISSTTALAASQQAPELRLAAAGSNGSSGATATALPDFTCAEPALAGFGAAAAGQRGGRPAMHLDTSSILRLLPADLSTAAPAGCGAQLAAAPAHAHTQDTTHLAVLSALQAHGVSVSSGVSAAGSTLAGYIAAVAAAAASKAAAGGGGADAAIAAASAAAAAAAAGLLQQQGGASLAAAHAIAGNSSTALVRPAFPSYTSEPGSGFAGTQHAAGSFPPSSGGLLCPLSAGGGAWDSSAAAVSNGVWAPAAAQRAGAGLAGLAAPGAASRLRSSASFSGATRAVAALGGCGMFSRNMSFNGGVGMPHCGPLMLMPAHQHQHAHAHQLCYAYPRPHAHGGTRTAGFGSHAGSGPSSKADPRSLRGVDPRLCVGSPQDVEAEVCRRNPGLAEILRLPPRSVRLANLPVMEDSPVLGGSSGGSVEAGGGGGGSSSSASKQAAAAAVDPALLVVESGLLRYCFGLPSSVGPELVRAARQAVTRGGVPGSGLEPFFWTLQAKTCWLLKRPVFFKGQLLRGEISGITDQQRADSFARVTEQRSRLGQLVVAVYALLSQQQRQQPAAAAQQQQQEQQEQEQEHQEQEHVAGGGSSDQQAQAPGGGGQVQEGAPEAVVAAPAPGAAA